MCEKWAAGEKLEGPEKLLSHSKIIISIIFYDAGKGQ